MKLPKGVKPLTPDRISKYAKGDISAFLEEQYVPPETRRTIELEWWQKEWILDPIFHTMKAPGKRQFNVALCGIPKKNGKSSLAAGIAVYELLCGVPAGEVIIAANDKDQASMIIYTKMRQSIALNPNLKRAARLLKSRIEVPSTGTIGRCIAHNHETAAGLNPTLTIFDELWGFTERKFYDELTVVPTRQNPLVLIVTYAGFEKEGLLWDLYCDGMEGETLIDTGNPEVFIKQGKRDKGLFMFWSHDNLASWVTEEYLDGQRARLPASVFARLHKNQWVSSGDRFITDADIDRLYSYGWVPQFGLVPDVRHVVSTDLGLSADRTCRCVGHYNRSDGRIYVDSLRLWEGSREHHVNLREVESDIERSCSAFATSYVVVDPWQMENTIQRLHGRYHVVPFSPQADTYRMSQIFTNLLLTGRLVCYPFEPLTTELKQTITRQTQRGWRIDHDKGGHNDVISAIGMMCLEAIRDEFGDDGVSLMLEGRDDARKLLPDDLPGMKKF